MQGLQRHIQSEILQPASGEWGGTYVEIRSTEIRMGAGNKCRVVPVAVFQAWGQDDDMSGRSGRQWWLATSWNRDPGDIKQPRSNSSSSWPSSPSSPRAVLYIPSFRRSASVGRLGWSSCLCLNISMRFNSSILAKFKFFPRYKIPIHQFQFLKNKIIRNIFRFM